MGISIHQHYCNSWAGPKAMLDKLDACHRRHLRSTTGHCWPKSIIANQALYKLCNEEPLSAKMVKSYAWILTHQLRRPWTLPSVAHKPTKPDRDGTAPTYY